ncbi:hypothetical protein ACP86_21890 [Marinobacter sp. CP1]|nr:hypothetical protein ACP86_21890 [Marinobacter sp. CP1]
MASNLAANSIRGDIVLFNHADQYRAIKKMISRFSLAKLNLFEVAHWMDSGLSKNIIYPSFALKKHLRKQGWVIPHGINLKFAVEPCIDKNSNLFFAGRLTKDKGIDIALAACKKIGCKLILAGPDNKSDYSKSILNDPSVIYLGELDYSQIFSQYYHSRGQIYLTQYVEPFGLSVIEAMAAGSPIITTGLGGTGETVLEGRTGFFCSTVDEIARAYEKLDTIAFDDLVSRAKDFTVERMARSYLDLFLST